MQKKHPMKKNGKCYRNIRDMNGVKKKVISAVQLANLQNQLERY
jgi:hypothetical protein